jgi:hypothetical protein
MKAIQWTIGLVVGAMILAVIYEGVFNLGFNNVL